MAKKNMTYIRNVPHGDVEFNCICRQQIINLYFNGGELDAGSCTSCGRQYRLEGVRYDVQLLSAVHYTFRKPLTASFRKDQNVRLRSGRTVPGIRKQDIGTIQDTATNASRVRVLWSSSDDRPDFECTMQVEDITTFEAGPQAPQFTGVEGQ